MTGFANARFDFPTSPPVKTVVVIASSYRSGSTHLSLELWASGRIGAPFEYFNYEKHMSFMMARLAVDDFDDYIRKLVKIRTSKNGVFAAKCHFHHFDMMQKKSASWRQYADVMKFIYVDRADKIGQAVSMAKALQSNAFLSFETPRQAPLFYSQEFLDECLKEVMRQTTAWSRWFNANEIAPFIVNHEEFVRDVPGHVSRIANWLGVEDDPAEPVDLPAAERQSDDVNREWKAKFLADRKKKIA